MRQDRLSRRRCLLALLTGATTGLAAGQIANGQAPANRSLGRMLDGRTRAAIRRGLAYLAGRQNEDDGTFGRVRYGGNVAVVSLAGMAFMAHGSMPGRGQYGLHVNRCIQYVLEQAQPSGFLSAPGNASHGPMYGHGFATLFLAEAYGMTPNRDVRDKLVKAVQLIVNTQNKQGGWRYHPQRRDADISVTICQVMALRAAKNAGVFVPNATIDRCIDYVKRCQNADGGFSYMLGQGKDSRFPRSAAGVVALYSAGIYEGEEIDRGLTFLRRHMPRARSPRGTHYFYGQYYAVQAMWHAGGEHFRAWYNAIRDVLLQRQDPRDGSWPDEIAPEYGTAMACIVLQMPNNYLPIFQR